MSEIIELKINPSFRDLIPPLADHEREGLEEDIKHFGCYTPIITWNGFIIDGHHRYEICTKHKLTFTTEEREFEDEIAVKRWMINNQFSRRNLPIEERLRLAFADTDLEELQAEAKERQGERNDLKESGPNICHLVGTSCGTEGGRVLEKVGEKAGCSHETARQYKKS